MQVTLAAARINAGLTQREVSESIKITQATLIAWEKGRLSPSVQKALDLCALYGCAMDDIMW